MMDLHFFEKLKNFNFNALNPNTLRKVKDKMASCPIGFTYEAYIKKSKPAGSLCNWIINWYSAGQAVSGVGKIT